MVEDGEGLKCKYLLRDRDAIYPTKKMKDYFCSEDIKVIKTPIQAPKANVYVESFIGTFKRECLNHFLIFHQGQLNYICKTWFKHYNTERPHRGKDKRIIRAQNNLVTQQFQSFGLAFGVIFICMLIGLRSIRLLLLSIPPNILPIASVFGLMGYFDISLNTGSVMVASVVLGIGVDDTVHMLVALARNQKKDSSTSKVKRETINTISPALVTTTTVIGCGFLVLTLSSFVPLTHFGFLASIAIFVALWADLRLVPALLLLRVGIP